LVRASGHVYAFALSCPHQNAALKWVVRDNRFACTKHDSIYQVDGVHTSGRATRNMDRYPIRREGGSLHVDIAQVFQSDKDPAGWAAATVTV
jgi:nitrite reductase/ring-hydroxylating ferredoxin subunit